MRWHGASVHPRGYLDRCTKSSSLCCTTGYAPSKPPRSAFTSTALPTVRAWQVKAAPSSPRGTAPRGSGQPAGGAPTAPEERPHGTADPAPRAAGAAPFGHLPEDEPRPGPLARRTLRSGGRASLQIPLSLSHLHPPAGPPARCLRPSPPGRPGAESRWLPPAQRHLPAAAPPSLPRAARPRARRGHPPGQDREAAASNGPGRPGHRPRPPPAPATPRPRPNLPHACAEPRPPPAARCPPPHLPARPRGTCCPAARPSPLWLTQVGFRSFIVPRPGPPPASALGTPGRLRPGCLRGRASGGAQRPLATMGPRRAPLCPPPPPAGAASAPLHAPAPPVPQPPPPGRIPRSAPGGSRQRRNSAPGNRLTGPAGNSRPRAPAFPRLGRRGARSREAPPPRLQGGRERPGG